MKGKRNRPLIIRDILRLLKRGPATITKIVYQINLNHESAEGHLQSLSQRELVSVAHSDEGHVTYKITGKGVDLLSDLEKTLTKLGGERSSRTAPWRGHSPLQPSQAE